MNLNKIYSIANSIAPKTISDEYCDRYGAYDNSGILVNTGEPIEKILFSLDLSKQAVEKAIETSSKLIVTHHPAIYGKIGGITIDDLLGEKLIACIKNGISVISMHLNLDCAIDGIDERFMLGVRKASGCKNELKKEDVSIMRPLENGGYGRAYGIEKMTAGELAERLKKEFSSEKIVVYGADRLVERAASFCGAGGDEEGVAFARLQKADVILSSDFKHHVITAAIEEGLSVIVLTHYASENYGFKNYYEKISRQTGLMCIYHEDESLL